MSGLNEQPNGGNQQWNPNQQQQWNQQPDPQQQQWNQQQQQFPQQLPQGPYPGPQQQPPKKKRTGLRVLAIVLGCFALLILLINLGSCGADNSGSPAVVTNTTAPKSQKSSAPKVETKTKVEKKTTTDAPKTTVGQQQAVLSAEQYLSTMAFSKKGLIKQLKFDKFSTADAQYAVTHITVDWNKQAELSAKSYLDTMPMSQGDLVTQLKFDGFTTAQAKHGAEAAYQSR